jgi:hypothetical protein
VPVREVTLPPNFTALVGEQIAINSFEAARNYARNGSIMPTA